MKLKEVKEDLREFLSFVSEKTKVDSLEILEKDFYLNLFLSELKEDDLIFKGGTCLSKCYLDYHRFSEDLDFTFRSSKIFEGKSSKETKKVCSSLVSEWGEIFERIAEKFAFDFKFVKNNPTYVQFGSGGRMVTFKFWYDSVFEGRSFVKIQINFLEKVFFPTIEKELKKLFDIRKLEDNEKKYFENFLSFYNLNFRYNVYSLEELACEKIRALLTRRTIKARDIIDLYFLRRMDFPNLKSNIIDKISSALESYQKYKENFNEMTAQELKKEDFSLEKDRYLLLKEISEEEFDNFLTKFLPFLEEIIKEIREEIKCQSAARQ